MSDFKAKMHQIRLPLVFSKPLCPSLFIVKKGKKDDGDGELTVGPIKII